MIMPIFMFVSLQSCAATFVLHWLLFAELVHHHQYYQDK